MKILFVTSNENKYQEAEDIVKSLVTNKNIFFDRIKIDLVEIQGTSDEVAIDKLKRAYKEIKTDYGDDTPSILIEDSCLGFKALGGLPGVYIRDFLKKLGVDDLPKLLNGFEDKSAEVKCTLGFMDNRQNKGKIMLFVGTTNGKIVEPRGKITFGWDPIFKPDFCEKTYAEMNENEKNNMSHRYKAFKNLCDYLQE
ncbi:hypothetical protein A3Q56_02113 [Intoshia linei]|uniref:XTP/dITP diphosphatase n=1 Tax=Intoshia linei TaxID=1819745 RepID=A0A177B795_9BILA|nr:hypothetical protein A3Q56_02113 [Intoshia linei]